MRVVDMKPQEFSQLSIQKKAHRLTLLYCKGKCFHNGKPNEAYFALRATFLKAAESDLNEMYLYLMHTEERVPLADLWKNCKQWNQERIQSHEASDYEPLSIQELL